MLYLERTKHGAKQQQGRATLPLWESLVLDHGTRVRSHGADLIFLDKAARKRIRKELGGERGMRVFERFWNQYLVVNDRNQIITTGNRYRRIRRA